jgi:heme/copper-type cytochrome/quinol oxidase subunit 2
MMFSGENVEKHQFFSFSCCISFLFRCCFYFFFVVVFISFSVFRFRGVDAKMKDEAGRLSGLRGSWVLLSIVTISFLAVVGGTALPHFYQYTKKLTLRHWRGL